MFTFKVFPNEYFTECSVEVEYNSRGTSHIIHMDNNDEDTIAVLLH